MAIQRGPAAQTDGTSTYTLRLTFTYERILVRLVASQRVEMIPPPNEPELIHQGQAGSWVELRDTEERILYQHILHNLLPHGVEAPEDPETGSLRWHKIDNPQGSFQLLVPDIADAQTLVLFSSPPEAFYEPAVELARFDLDAVRRSSEVKP